jgi:hypothetical protein
MSEGKWVKVKHGEIEEGDVVRVISKDGPQTITTEGKVTSIIVHRDGEKVWSIENFESFYSREFIPDEDGNFATLERIVPPFKWPTKLGAVVRGENEDEDVYAVLVEEAKSKDDIPVFYTKEWGVVNMYDIEGLEDLTVVFEGVTVEA